MKKTVTIWIVILFLTRVGYVDVSLLPDFGESR